MSRMWSGVDPVGDEAYWTRWVELRQKEIKQIAETVKVFISPSRHLKKRLVSELGLPGHKIVFEPYGFKISNLMGRIRKREPCFVFGYIGRIDPSKGINHLIKAFGMIEGKAKLRIWGRPSAQDTPSTYGTNKRTTSASI